MKIKTTKTISILFSLTFFAGVISLLNAPFAQAQQNIFQNVSVPEVTIIQAPSNYVFIDMGYDLLNDELAIVGDVVEGSENLPTVFEMNASQDEVDPIIWTTGGQFLDRR